MYCIPTMSDLMIDNCCLIVACLLFIHQVTKRTSLPVKFWLFENYLSPSFKTIAAAMAQEYHFEVCVGVCYSFVCLLVCLFVCLFVCLLVCLFVCLFVYLFVCLFVLSSLIYYHHVAHRPFLSITTTPPTLPLQLPLRPFLSIRLPM